MSRTFASNSVYEVLTVEFISAIAGYIFDRCQVLTARYVQSCPNLSQLESVDVFVLELGCGDGRLAHFLKQRLDIMCLRSNVGLNASGVPKMKIRYTACDNLSFGVAPGFPEIIQKLTHSEALAKYCSGSNATQMPAAPASKTAQVPAAASSITATPPTPPAQSPTTSPVPVFVLVSWMPGGDDWTSDIRSCKAVQVTSSLSPAPAAVPTDPYKCAH